MGRAVHCTAAERKTILALRNRRDPIRKIAKDIGCSTRKVFNALHHKKKLQRPERSAQNVLKRQKGFEPEVKKESFYVLQRAAAGDRTESEW